MLTVRLRTCSVETSGVPSTGRPGPGQFHVSVRAFVKRIECIFRKCILYIGLHIVRIALDNRIVYYIFIDTYAVVSIFKLVV